MSIFEQARNLFLQALARHQAGRFAEAEALYRQAHALMPDRVSILANLATVLLEQQRPREAWVFCERALAIEPQHPEALAARALCASALAADPHNPDLHAQRAALLARRGRSGEALEEYRLALRSDPGAHAAGLGFMHLVLETGHAPGRGDREFEALALRGMRAPWAKPAAVAMVLLALLRSEPAMARLLDPRAARPVLSPAAIAALADDPLLAALLEGALVPDAGFERFATTLRGQLLQQAAAPDRADDPRLLALHCALATQCHLNDHVYATPADELACARALRDRLQAALAGSAPPPAAQWWPAVASYLPLAELQGIDAVLAQSWPEPVARLLDRTVREPLDERRRQAGLQRLTPVIDAVSGAVRAQYEQNPYPKWPSLARSPRMLDLAEYVRNRIPECGYQPCHAAGRVEVLNAGCGTGQQPIDTALRLAGAQILAVDLSLASLAYGARMAEAMGVRNVQFAQADLLELSYLGRRFDLIESTGVLHHLARPAQGLGVLAALLAPGGAIRLSLYSRAARRCVVAARAMIADQGLQPVPDDIRRCREAITALPDAAPARAVMAFADFYSLNECRDLLFHVQEHHFDLPGVHSLLADAGLRLLGLELEPAQRAAAARDPGGPHPTSGLDAWAAFEARHPDFFAGMYHVWAMRAQ